MNSIVAILLKEIDYFMMYSFSIIIRFAPKDTFKVAKQIFKGR